MSGWKEWIGVGMIYTLVLIGLIFPDEIWNEDTVEITDEQGNVLILPADEVMNELYTTDEITIDLRLFHWLDSE